MKILFMNQKRGYVFCFACGYVILVTVILYSFFRNYAYDDPFITYRYSFNLSHGDGFVYNLGQKNLSTTTPLFTLILAGFHLMGIHIHHLATFLGAFGVAMGAFFLWALSKIWKTPWVGEICLILYPTFPLMTSTIGSETPLYVAFCLGTIAAYAANRYTWCAVCLALATLARPDGILVGVVLVLHFLLLRRQPVPWKSVLLFIVMMVAWFGFAWAYFGQPLPVTLMAKHQQGNMAISQKFAPGFLKLLEEYSSAWFLGLLGGIGLIVALRQRSPWLILLGWTGLYFMAYSVLGVSRYFWYYAPLVPGFIVLVGIGISGLVRAGAGRSKRAKKVVYALVPVALLFCAAWQGSQVQKLALRSDPRFAIYSQVGRWLQHNTPADASVGTLEVGIIGYYAQRTMVDFAGLIQPEVNQWFSSATTYEDAALWAANHFHPDYLVLQKGLFKELQTTYVASKCILVHTVLDDTHRYPYPMEIYHCFKP